jgi:hypothetical protein
LAVADPARAGDLLRDAIAINTRALGPDHPDTLRAVAMDGALTRDLEQASKLLRSAAEAFSKLHPSLSVPAASAWIELALVEHELGHDALALDAFGRAADIEARSPDGGAVLAPAYRALYGGDPKAAATLFERDISDSSGDNWYEHAARGEAEIGLGAALLELTAPDALMHLTLGVKTLVEATKNHTAAAYARRVARGRARLALARAAAHADPVETADLARGALEMLRLEGARTSDLAELERLSKAAK